MTGWFLIDWVAFSVFEILVGQVVIGIPFLGVSLYFLLEAFGLRVSEIMKDLNLCLFLFKANLVIILLP